MNTPTVPELLRAAASTYEERNKAYGDNYKKSGAALAAMFPEGLPPMGAQDWNEFGVWFMIFVKLSRYAENIGKGGHVDSAHDMVVYAAMLEELTKS